MVWAKRSAVSGPPEVDREVVWLFCAYGPKLTVIVLEQVWVPASHTLYMKLAWPVVPVESSYKPSFGVVAITTLVELAGSHALPAGHALGSAAVRVDFFS